MRSARDMGLDTSSTVKQARDRGAAGGYGGEGAMEGKPSVQKTRMGEKKHAEGEAGRRIMPDGQNKGGVEMDRQREGGGGWNG